MAKNLKQRELVRLSDSVLRAESAKERLRYALTHTEAELRAFYGTGKEGLSDAAAAANRERFGSNGQRRLPVPRFIRLHAVRLLSHV